MNRPPKSPEDLVDGKVLQHPTRAMYVPDEKEKTNGGA